MSSSRRAATGATSAAQTPGSVPERHVNPAFHRVYYPESAHLTDAEIRRHFKTRASRQEYANEREFMGDSASKRRLPADFSGLHYVIANRDLWHIRSDWEAVLHFLREGAQAGRPHELPFDPAFYRAQYFPNRPDISADDLHGDWQAARAERYGSLDEALVRNGFTSADWTRGFPHWPYIAHNGLAAIVRNETQALIHFITTGCKQLLSLGQGAMFDPCFCRQFSNRFAGLSDAELYAVWVQASNLSAFFPNETIYLASQRITLSRVPDGFLWQDYLPGATREENKWTAFVRFAREGVLEAKPLPLTDDCAATVLTVLADHHAVAGALEKAARLYDRALLHEADPNCHLLQHAADMALRSGRPELALRLYEQVEKDGQTLWTFANAAMAAMDCGEMDRARHYLLVGLQAFPRSRVLRERLRTWLNKAYELAVHAHIASLRVGSPEADDVLIARLRQIYAVVLDAFLTGTAPAKQSGAGIGREPFWVVMLANKDLPQCTFYRVDQKAEQFAACGVAFQAVEQSRGEEFITAASTADAIIFYRIAATVESMLCLAWCEANGVPTFYDIDDLVFDAEHFPEEFAAYGDAITADQHFDLRRGVALVKAAIGWCDYGIASTRRLSDRLAPLVRKQTALVHRNSLSVKVQPATHEAAAHLRTAGPVLFYGSGTKAHARDFQDLLAPALNTLMSRHPGVGLITVGFVDVSALALQFSGRVEHVPYVPDRDVYLSLLAATDINLAVLSKNAFNDCKSEIKWLEAAAFGIPSVVPDVAGMREVVKDGRDAIVVDGDSAAAWLQALERLAGDAVLRQEIGSRAKGKVLRDYADRDAGQHLTKGMIGLLSPAAPHHEQARKRILVVHVVFPPQATGGATRVVSDQVQILAEQHGEHCELAVFCANAEEVAPYQLERYTWNGVAVYAVGVVYRPHMDWIPFDENIGAVFDRVLDHFVPDLVHFHCIQRLTCAVVERAAERGLPFVVTVHDAWWISDHQFLLDGLNTLRLPWEPEACGGRANPHTHIESSARKLRLALCLRKARAVIAVSDTFADLYRQAGIDKVTAIPNGVPRLPPLIPSEPPPGKLRLGHIGGPAYHKGYFLLQDTLARGQFDALEVLAVDLTWEAGEERFEQWGLSTARIIGPVPQDRIGWLYGQFDVLVAPSLWPESFGLVVREALAYGRWVIVSDRGAMAEAVTHGRNGFVVDVSTPDGLAQTLALLQNDVACYRRPPEVTFAARTVLEQVTEVFALYHSILGDLEEPCNEARPAEPGIQGVRPEDGKKFGRHHPSRGRTRVGRATASASPLP
jgi:glycosyltransferase involved in cell wall biosynthesis